MSNRKVLAELVTKQVRRCRPVCSPPGSGRADVLAGLRSNLERHAYYSTVEIPQDFLCGDEVSTANLCLSLKELAQAVVV